MEIARCTHHASGNLALNTHMLPYREHIRLTLPVASVYLKRMRIIARRTLTEFQERFPDSKAQLDAWWAEAKRAKWAGPADIKAQYRSASILKGGRVVFNICGNKYRIIVLFHYEKGIGYVRFLGTHKEYDQINAEGV